MGGAFFLLPAPRLLESPLTLIPQQVASSDFFPIFQAYVVVFTIGEKAYAPLAQWERAAAF